MFRFVTKKDYWGISDLIGLAEIESKAKTPWHLKSIQDGIASSHLCDYSGKIVAEIGGGDSRLLPILARNNTCFNLEEFKGVAGGPKK